MNKTRGLLSFVVLSTMVGQILILHSHLTNDWRFILHVADGILLLSALIMLLFSFFQVGVTACGELCYNPDNWYWKTMSYLYDELSVSNPFSRGEVSLCKAFWLTVIAISMTMVLASTLVILVSLILAIYWKLGLLKFILGMLIIIAFFAIIIGAIWSLIFVLEKSSDKYYNFVSNKPKLENAGKMIESFLKKLVAFGLVFTILVILPITVIMEKIKVSLLVAVIYYLIGMAGIILTIGGSILLIWFLFKYLPRTIGNTVLGQFLSAKKRQFCPTLTACRIN